MRIGVTRRNPEEAQLSASMEVLARLRDHILSGQYQPEAKLRFADLQAEFAVGIGTLREALSQLLSEGLVTLDAGRGFRVAPVSEEELLDITRLHVDFEQRAIRNSVAHGDDEWEGRVLTAFHRLSKLEALPRGERMARHAEWVERHRAFHEALVSACRSRWLLNFRALMFDQSERYRLLSKRYRPANSQKLQEHVSIKDAALNREAERAAQLIDRHIMETAETVLKFAPQMIQENPPRHRIETYAAPWRQTFERNDLMETPVSFPSDGLTLSGVLHVPATYKAGEKLPAFLVLHGFMGSKDESHGEIQARMLADWGYAALRFDMRGCGDSGGTRGFVLCLDQVADTRNALTWLAQRPEIDPRRIGVIGHSFGAAVAVYTAGVDERVAAVISSCGWGHGERKFRGQHPGAGALGQVHGHARARPRAQGEDRRVALGIALGRGPDSRASAQAPAEEGAVAGTGRDRAEHGRLPRRGGGRQDRAAAADAAAHRRRPGDADRTVAAHVRTRGHADRALSDHRRVALSARRRRQAGARYHQGLARPVLSVALRNKNSMSEQSVRISKAALQDFAAAIFVAAGIERAMSEEWARVLIWANLRGVDSHGVLRIPRYLDLIAKRAINPAPTCGSSGAPAPSPCSKPIARRAPSP